MYWQLFQRIQKLHVSTKQLIDDRGRVQSCVFLQLSARTLALHSSRYTGIFRFSNQVCTIYLLLLLQKSYSFLILCSFIVFDFFRCQTACCSICEMQYYPPPWTDNTPRACLNWIFRELSTDLLIHCDRDHTCSWHEGHA